MKDLEFVENVFTGMKILWCVLFGISSLFLMILCFNGAYQAFFVLIANVIIWYIGFIGIKISNIIYARFVAATENILEITLMLENKFNDKK